MIRALISSAPQLCKLQRCSAIFVFLTVAGYLQLVSANPSEGELAQDESKKDQSEVRGANESKSSDVSSFVIRGDLSEVDWQKHVGKQVVIEGDLVIVDTYDLARRGQITVSRNRLFVPTSQIDPNDQDADGTTSVGGSNSAAVVEAQSRNRRSSIMIDDAVTDQNVFPPPLFPTLGKIHPTVRLGSVVHEVSGLVVKQGNRIFLQVGQPLRWSPAPRPQRPDLGDAEITIASFNVLNYFTTIDDGRNKARGADSDSELVRQQAKIEAAISGLDADVIGLMELENNLDAESRLIAALNKSVGRDVYKGCGVPALFSDSPGGDDAIRVGIIYRSDRVEATERVTMIDSAEFSLARTPLVQTFRPADGGATFTVIVNHFKSKGGGGSAGAENKDRGDGQAAYNAARRSQSLAICRYIDSEHQGVKASRVIVLGDLNAYQQEDPIDALRAKGLVDLTEHVKRKVSTEFVDTDYSYVYFGQCGSLDHAFATPPLVKDVTGVSIWHINADEPRWLDYNQEYNPRSIYKADAFRSSDHDPVLIGIRK